MILTIIDTEDDLVCIIGMAKPVLLSFICCALCERSLPESHGYEELGLTTTHCILTDPTLDWLWHVVVVIINNLNIIIMYTPPPATDYDIDLSRREQKPRDYTHLIVCILIILIIIIF